MRSYEAAAVVEVIEQLIAELGIDKVPQEIDIDGALVILNEVIYGEDDGSKEEGADTPVGSAEAQVVEPQPA